MATQVPEEQGTLIGRGRTADIYAWGDGLALKLYYEGWSHAAVEHEAQISRLVAAAGAPAPSASGPFTVNGRYGILFERLVGPTLLHQVAARPWTIRRAVRAFADLHLATHARVVGDHSLPTQRERLERQISDAPLVSDRIRAAALRRLEHLPEGSALCHGDYHPDNVLMTGHGPIIIDWASASRGHPLADVAQTELLLQIGEPPATPSRIERVLLAVARTYVRRAYLRRYFRRYLRHGTTRQEELAAWRLPIAVARLADEIPGEQSKLLRLIEREMASREL